MNILMKSIEIPSLEDGNSASCAFSHWSLERSAAASRPSTLRLRARPRPRALGMQLMGLALWALQHGHVRSVSSRIWGNVYILSFGGEVN